MRGRDSVIGLGALAPIGMRTAGDAARRLLRSIAGMMQATWFGDGNRTL